MNALPEDCSVDDVHWDSKGKTEGAPRREVCSAVLGEPDPVVVAVIADPLLRDLQCTSLPAQENNLDGQSDNEQQQKQGLSPKQNR